MNHLHHSSSTIRKSRWRRYTFALLAVLLLTTQGCVSHPDSDPDDRFRNPDKDAISRGKLPNSRSHNLKRISSCGELKDLYIPSAVEDYLRPDRYQLPHTLASEESRYYRTLYNSAIKSSDKITHTRTLLGAGPLVSTGTYTYVVRNNFIDIFKTWKPTETKLITSIDLSRYTRKYSQKYSTLKDENLANQIAEVITSVKLVVSGTKLYAFAEIEPTFIPENQIEWGLKGIERGTRFFTFDIADYSDLTPSQIIDFPGKLENINFDKNRPRLVIDYYLNDTMTTAIESAINTSIERKFDDIYFSKLRRGSHFQPENVELLDLLSYRTYLNDFLKSAITEQTIQNGLPNVYYLKNDLSIKNSQPQFSCQGLYAKDINASRRIIGVSNIDSIGNLSNSQLGVVGDFYKVEVPVNLLSDTFPTKMNRLALVDETTDYVEVSGAPNSNLPVKPDGRIYEEPVVREITNRFSSLHLFDLNDSAKGAPLIKEVSVDGIINPLFDIFPNELRDNSSEGELSILYERRDKDADRKNYNQYSAYTLNFVGYYFESTDYRLKTELPNLAKIERDKSYNFSDSYTINVPSTSLLLTLNPDRATHTYTSKKIRIAGNPTILFREPLLNASPSMKTLYSFFPEDQSILLYALADKYPPQPYIQYAEASQDFATTLRVMAKNPASFLYNVDHSGISPTLILPTFSPNGKDENLNKDGFLFYPLDLTVTINKPKLIEHGVRFNSICSGLCRTEGNSLQPQGAKRENAPFYVVQIKSDETADFDNPNDIDHLTAYYYTFTDNGYIAVDTKANPTATISYNK